MLTVVRDRLLERRVRRLLRDPQHNVVAVIQRANGRRELRVAKNIITDAGDVFYAQRMAGEAVTNNFNRLALGTGRTAAWAKNSTYGNLTGAIAGSIKAFDATFPQRNNQDAANGQGGVNVVTYKVTYTSADFTSATNVTDGVITITGPVSGSPLLAGFTFATPFTLAANESVVIYVNHSTTGS